MKKFSFFLSLGMLFIFTSCEDSINSLEDTEKVVSEQLGNDNDFITFRSPDGKIIQKSIPEELKKNEVAQSRSTCTMYVTNPTNEFEGVSVDGANVYAYANSTVTEQCPCTGGYIWLVSGSSITWVLKDGTNILDDGALGSGEWIYYNLD